jgi:hypothetical protein
MPSSMSAALAMPSCRANIASLIIGQSTRLTAKPGEFFTWMGVLPMRYPDELGGLRFWVASLVVSSPRISSTSPIKRQRD